MTLNYGLVGGVDHDESIIGPHALETLGCRLWCVGPARRPREPLGGGTDGEGVTAILGVAGGGWEKSAALARGAVSSCIPCDDRAGGVGLAAVRGKCQSRGPSAPANP